MNIETPLPIRKALLARKTNPKMVLPSRPFPWRRLTIVMLAGIVIGNATITLFLYVIGRPDLTAWTNHVMEATPGAVNDLCLGIVNLLLALYLLKRCP